MSEEQVQLEVYETPRFNKALKKLPDVQVKIIEDEVEEIINNPEIGERKKGDLNHLWVHKFKLEGSEVLLGYSWVEDMLELYLLSVGSHENYYKDQKKSRTADLRLMKE